MIAEYQLLPRRDCAPYLTFPMPPIAIIDPNKRTNEERDIQILLLAIVNYECGAAASHRCMRAASWIAQGVIDKPNFNNFMFTLFSIMFSYRANKSW